jgi:hypothetical protein
MSLFRSRRTRNGWPAPLGELLALACEIRDQPQTQKEAAIVTAS